MCSKKRMSDPFDPPSTTGWSQISAERRKSVDHTSRHRDRSTGDTALGGASWTSFSDDPGRVPRVFEICTVTPGL